ncbi:MAG: hypothetical protein OHK0013_10560 [Sandaracinaceae bacterium]
MLGPSSARAALVALALTIVGCPEGPSDLPPMPRRDAGPPAECVGVEPDRPACEGTSAIRCSAAGQIVERVECADRGEICVSGLGCRVCAPGTIACDGETVLRCNADGTVAMRGETCDSASGERCSPGGCARLCEQAEAERSYLGCAYVAVPTANTELDPAFDFAVAIANPQLVPAEVVIERGSVFSTSVTVAPGALEIVTLPWIDALRVPASTTSYVSVVQPDGGYRLRSDVPVTVHQFNPLTFVEPTDCSDAFDPRPGDGRCNSYTNDASLLLPLHALTGSYLVMSRPTHLVDDGGRVGGSPGFVAIVGVEEGPVEVTLRTRAHTLASADGLIAAHAPGDVFSLTVRPGEVVQLLSAVPSSCPTPVPERDPRVDVDYCDLGPDYDLTGTEISASGRVAVFSGHNCTFVPFDRWACDHLEEQLFPAEAFGTSAVAPLALQQRSEPSLVRIVSAADGNEVTFSPANDSGIDTITLDRGEHVEVTIRRATRITGTLPFLGARFLVGQDYQGIGTAGSDAPGDPSMGLLVPDQQWRNQYVFLTPDTYSASYLDVIAAAGQRVELDGQVLAMREAVGTGVSVATINLRPGVHRLRGALPVGAHVYGYASYTSYLAPAGLDLREIADPL